MDNNGGQRNVVCEWVSGLVSLPANTHEFIANQISDEGDYDIANSAELSVLEKLMSYLVIPKSLGNIPHLKTLVLHVVHENLRPIVSNSITKIELEICQAAKNQPAIDFSGTSRLESLIISTRAFNKEVVISRLPESLKTLNANCIVFDCNFPKEMDSVIIFDGDATVERPVIDAKKITVAFPIKFTERVESLYAPETDPDLTAYKNLKEVAMDVNYPRTYACEEIRFYPDRSNEKLSIDIEKYTKILKISCRMYPKKISLNFADNLAYLDLFLVKLEKVEFPSSLTRLSIHNCTMWDIVDLHKTQLTILFIRRAFDTNQINLPDTITTMEITNNTTITINNIPDSLTEFTASKNVKYPALHERVVLHLDN